MFASIIPVSYQSRPQVAPVKPVPVITVWCTAGKSIPDAMYMPVITVWALFVVAPDAKATAAVVDT